MTETPTLRSRLRALREERGLSQRKLAALARLPQQVVNDVECNDRPRVSARVVFALARALGVDPRSLLPEEGR